ncbi:MAG TPA: hypothetical protein DEP18_03505 [Flavobacteriales bacterium]|nr:hypothetical protein [Flavobacteriales bacterium]HRE73765.1 hypothetical protein [Flavobacteriales bacterium]HRE95664.1 hypothetical protein [Flavobacteriales bacterium]
MFSLLRSLLLLLLPLTALAQDSTGIVNQKENEPGVLRYFLLAVLVVGLIVMYFERRQKQKLNNNQE